MIPDVETTQEQRKLAAAFDPRIPLYRDSFNEKLVFTLSAVGAVAAVPVILLVIGAIFGRLSPAVFVIVGVLLEWFFIFAVGRPQMTQPQALAWAAMWGTIAAVFGAAFYDLVVLAL
jgi:hypothetical protein